MLDDRIQTVRSRSGEESRSDCIRKTVKFPTKIMVWGTNSIHGTRRLFIVEGTMNAKKYIEVLSSRLKPQIHEWFGGNPCVFQQDSAPCHTAKKAHEWMKKNHSTLLPWPGNSPDNESYRKFMGCFER